MTRKNIKNRTCILVVVLRKKADFISLYRSTRGEQCILPSKAYSAAFHKIHTEAVDVQTG